MNIVHRKKLTFGFHRLRNLVINKPVLVVDLFLFELRFVVALVNLLEDVFEAAVVLLEDGVLSAQKKRIATVQSVGHRGMRKIPDAFVHVVHGHRNAWTAELVNTVDLLWRAVIWLESELECARRIDGGVHTLVLIAERVTADYDRLAPAGHQSGNILANDRLSEHRTSQNVSNRT